MCILSQCVYKTSGRKMKLYNSFMCLDKTLFFSFCLWGGGGGGGRGGLGAELRERKGWLGQLAFFNTCKENSLIILKIGT